jgi:hypothetical protein
MKLPKSKRLRFTIVAFILNFLTVWTGMYFKADLTALGVCLMMINTPLYTYVLGESFKPSTQEKDV